MADVGVGGLAEDPVLLREEIWCYALCHSAVWSSGVQRCAAQCTVRKHMSARHSRETCYLGAG